ncbi:hypothetical protein PIB30_015520 [Stylosanthes scabra]|uniref:Uncharacterized protein n=1 Tax=Stylosanthes scabra TaxID=79078 RepID=A0ABU6Y3Z5_9FABA|nr:hypothetical protein [Stylosanthes scabra]
MNGDEKSGENAKLGNKRNDGMKQRIIRDFKSQKNENNKPTYLGAEGDGARDLLQLVSPRRFAPDGDPTKWYQSRWLIGLVLMSIYEKHQKSSRQDGSSGESHGLCGGVMDKYSKCGEGARGVVLDVETHT